MKKSRFLLTAVMALSTLVGCKTIKITVNESTAPKESSEETSSFIQPSVSDVLESEEKSESVSENHSVEDSSSSHDDSSSDMDSSSSHDDSSSVMDSSSSHDDWDTVTIEQALNIAKNLAPGAETDSFYTITGTLTGIYNTTYGNAKLVSGTSSIEIYGMYNFNGKIRYDAMNPQPIEGDVLVLNGKLKNFYNKNDEQKLEIVNAWVLAINGVDQSTVEQTSEHTSEDIPGTYDADGWTYTGNYYDSIDVSNTSTLLTQLRQLDSKKHTKFLTYKSLWNYFDKTDYDPNNPSKYIAFYRGTSASQGEMNKEHVWPNSRGGNLVEGDIHMVRPTLTSDNSSRGNSFYVEGMNSSSAGWDPYADGMLAKYRGIAARIVFYCVVANSSLKLVDANNDSTSNNSMGKLSDLLKWNLQYDIDITEVNRNNGAESIQGNRNPFIDNRKLPCAIWGNTNANTKKICSGQVIEDDKPSEKESSSPEVESSEEHISIDPTDKRVYQLVSSQSDLTVGGQYIIVCNEFNFAMTTSMPGAYAGYYDVDISNNKIYVSDSDTIAEFVLGGSAGAYTLTEATNGLLGVTAVKKLAYNDGTTTWNITVSSGIATIASTTSSYGNLEFNGNASAYRFTTYASGQKPVSLYKLVD